MLIPLVQIASCRVGLPDLDQRFTNRPAILVTDLPADEDAFAEWFAVALAREVERVHSRDIFPKNRPCDFRKSIRKRDQWLCGSTL